MLPIGKVIKKHVEMKKQVKMKEAEIAVLVDKLLRKAYPPYENFKQLDQIESQPFDLLLQNQPYTIDVDLGYGGSIRIRFMKNGWGVQKNMDIQWCFLSLYADDFFESLKHADPLIIEWTVLPPK